MTTAPWTQGPISSWATTATWRRDPSHYQGVPILHSIGNVTLLPRGGNGEP
jgi:hypothetical protein